MGSLLEQVDQSGISVWIREGGVLYGYPLILFLHTMGLSTLVGLSCAINLRLLGVAAGIPLKAFERLFLLMWPGFALTATTGLLLFVADAKRHASNPAFPLKLILVSIAITALVLMSTRVFREQRSGKVLAAVSFACWFGALTAGRMMAYIAEFVA